MNRPIPGTTLTLPKGHEGDAFALLEPLFAISGGGLTLSQVCELSGLVPSTVQNWVKRGWVSNPVNKRYSKQQVARILMMNLLRPTMQLEDIVTLLGYVNGAVDDRTDDSMPDSALFALLCRAIFRLEDGYAVEGEELRKMIGLALAGVPVTVPDREERLYRALEVMLLNGKAAMLMGKASTILAQIRADETGKPGKSIA